MRITPNTLWADSETYNAVVDISAGAHRYAEDAEILLFPFAFGDGPVEVYDLTDRHTLADVQCVLRDAEQIVFHNAAFDLAVARSVGLEIDQSRVHCTMVQAMAHGLVGKLETLCEILGLDPDLAKHKDGKKLIHLFTKPRPKNMKLRRATRETHPEEWSRFIDYAASDIVSMREVFKRIPKWNTTPLEQHLWQLDQNINNRGIKVDADLARGALRAFERVKLDLAEETKRLTGGAVSSTTQVDALRQFMKDADGLDLPDLTKGTVAEVLKQDDLPVLSRRLLNIRAEASSTTPSKYRTMLKSMCADGRIKGMVQFNGAARTGRDAGRIVQLQNLARPAFKNHVLEAFIEAIKAEAEYFIYSNVGPLCVSSVRGSLVADEHMKLLFADLSNIEGRVLAWLADEAWKIQAFRDFDAGVGPDLYLASYARAFGVAVDTVTGDQRQIGKVMELALGYQGSVGAFASMAAVYGVNLPEEVVLDLVKKWRMAHRRIVNMWYRLEDAAKDAIANPYELFDCGMLAFDCVKHPETGDMYLRMRLPSGRYLCYMRPFLRDGKIYFEGLNQYTRKWTTLDTYGGKLAENATQATARDVFMHGLRMAEAGGYPVVLRVHDELGVEVPDTDEFSAKKLEAFMSTNPSWAAGLPLAAAGFETYRYRKE